MKSIERLNKCIHSYNYGVYAVLLFLMLLMQRLILSFRYYPIIDDWFLYFGRSVYPAGERHLDLATRPFAGLADFFIITPLSGHMIIITLIHVVMLCLAAYFFCKAFERAGISCGIVFMLVVAMTPTGFEGFYWIAAASRIIPSLLFISASAFALTLYLDKGDKVYLILYILCGIFASGFYEIFLPIYFLVNLFIILRHKKSYWLIIIPLCISVLMLMYYFFNKSDPAISERATMVAADDLINHTIFTFGEYENLLAHINAALIRESFTDGIRTMAAKPLMLILLILLSAAVGFIAENNKKYHARLNLFIGILLILAGMALSFCIGFVRLPFRLVVPLLPGAAVIAELIISRLFGKYGYKICVFLLAFIFSVCNIGELSVYKQSSDQDWEYTERFSDIAEVQDLNYVTFICNAKEYWYDDRVQHLEYVKAITENYAALTGMIRYQTGNYQINNAIPLYDNAVVGIQDFESDDINMVYLNENNEFCKCWAARTETGYEIHDAEGRLIGLLTLQNDHYIYSANLI